ncbi:hypothetical protein C2E21_9290 [Chlorella sorokiniana]|uniref:Uncharacterized protein n=1 Tax=Chlorella sorokiniana TaxID=3076 RepID=A0A2P6TBR7_CHLSO|nr:hypothetical protein C2E21_9290 [Chlorella sorokiniana]|eukprot:PRW18329.1 hypothetical protein C2E21_9290 [Chlorella sorokiniana]
MEQPPAVGVGKPPQPTTLAASMQQSPSKRPPLQVPNAQPQAQQQQGSPGLPSKRRLAW